MGKVHKIVVSYLRFQFWYVAVVLLTVILSLPLFVGMNDLDLTGSATILECIFTLVGTAVFLPLFLPESNEAVFQLIKTKKTDVRLLFILRTGLNIMTGLLLLLLFLKMLAQGSSVVDFWRFFAVGAGNIFFLGGMLTLGIAIFRQVVIGMIFPLLYYSFCLFVRNSAQYVGSFYLFHLSRFNDPEKWWLLCLAGLIMLGLGILIRCNRKSGD